jgi:hypothetical protein
LETIRPEATRIRRLIWLLAGTAGVGTLVTLLALGTGSRSHSFSRTLAAGATMLVIGALGAGYLRLWLANSRLLVGGEVFGYQDLLGRPHTWMSSEVSAVIDVPVAYNARTVPRRAIYFIGLDGRKLFTLNPIAWNDSSIDRLIRAAGKPVQVRAQPVPAAAFRQEYPRAVSWAATHTTFTGSLLAIGLILLGLGIPILTIWVHW